MRIHEVPFCSRVIIVVVAALTNPIVGCNDAEDGTRTVGDGSGTYCKVNNEYREYFCRLYERLLTESVIVHGDDVEDFGDSMAYSCAVVFALQARGMAGAKELAFAAELIRGYRSKVQRFSANPLVILCDDTLAMEVYIGVLGMLVGYEATEDPGYLETADCYFDTMTSLLALFGPLIYFIEIDPYGPTTIKSGLAGSLLHYALVTKGTGRSRERLEQGIEILEEMNFMTWDDKVGGYRYLAQPAHSYEYMYSNVTAVQALVRAWKLTGDRGYLDRAEIIMEGLEVLYSEDYGGYLASDERYPQAPHHGEEYIALSAQNYTIMADLLLYQVTGKRTYYERALRIFEFVWRALWVESEALCFHDIQHGQLADNYCTGCNWQLLYNLVLLDHLRMGIDLLP